MLHPALSRFLAVLLAILCLVLFLTSYFGLSETDELKNDDIASYNKLTERIATYERLTAELAQIEEYKKADEKLSAQEEEHNSTASQHRTELAEHTAKEGAFKQGADALWEARAKIDEQRIALDYNVGLFNQKVAEFEKMKQMVQGLGQLAQGSAAVAGIPAIPDPGPLPEEPQPPSPPNPADYAEGENDAAYQQALGEYNSAQQSYEQYEAHKMQLAAYQQYSATVAPIMQGGAAALAALGKPVPTDIAGMAQALQEANAELGPTIEAAEKGIAEGRAALEAAQKALDDGEHTIQSKLELIWYQMGQAEEQAQELAKEKEELAVNSAQLEKERELLEKQKENENKLRSTRILLMQNKTIEERVNAGGELAEVSGQYAEEFKVQYEKQYEIRRVICWLGIAAGIVGILMLPAAFELIHSRLLLLMPAILSFLASALAEFLSVRSGEGQFYTAIPVIFFSLFYVLAARGRKKIPR
ncbi:MAG: hypothetical protein IJB09_09085 [Oscillospiraceae bacterium]|nr:hypothetical protein [Oscillospiraceae bacterium]